MLQSKNSDVEAELDIMRAYPKHRHTVFMLMGGDGLAVSRVNHALAHNSQKYIRQAPAIIPVQ
eukprot:1672129-Pleurochrysis_carterae.AAC.1